MPCELGHAVLGGEPLGMMRVAHGAASMAVVRAYAGVPLARRGVQ